MKDGVVDVIAQVLLALVVCVILFLAIAGLSSALSDANPSDHIGEVYESVTCPVCEDAHAHWRKP